MKRFVSSVGVFFSCLGGCFSKAWQDSDCHYYIPKSRFADPEFNQTAYSAAEVQGVLSRVGVFFRTLGDCVSMAWKESDHYHHIPKSRYQDPSFVREKMAATPKPQARFVIPPLIIGMGVAGEDNEDGWLARPSGYQYDEEFIIPEDEAGVGRKPEIDLE